MCIQKTHPQIIFEVRSFISVYFNKNLFTKVFRREKTQSNKSIFQPRDSLPSEFCSVTLPQCTSSGVFMWIGKAKWVGFLPLFVALLLKQLPSYQVYLIFWEGHFPFFSNRAAMWGLEWNTNQTTFSENASMVSWPDCELERGERF